MPNQADSSQKPPRRSKRNPKAQGPSSSSSQTPSKTNLNTTHNESNMPPAQATQIQSIRDPAMPVDSRERFNAESSILSTPPRSRSTQPSSTRRDQMANEPVPGATNRREGNKSQNAKQKAQTRPSQGGTPSTAARSNALTPGRASETPSKAYAGPTFHASPAASSLPMPRFFSKSVPNVDKASSLKNMVEPDAPDTASENEESPFVDRTKPEPDRQVREESPLDIFFHADRRAKANVNSSSSTNGTPGGLSPFDSLRPDASPSRGTPRHHSRHPTDSSIGGVFNLEMGSPAPENADRVPSKSQQPAYDRSVSAPSGGMTEEQAREEQRQASTLALKNMLLLPQNQRSEISNPGMEHASTTLGSPSPKPRQQQISPTRDQFRPSSSPGLASDASRVQRQAALRALAEKQIPSTNGYTPQRPVTSSLRKEVTMPNSSGRYYPLDQHSTPTPPRRHGSPPSANTRSQARNRNVASENDNIPTQGLQNLTLNSKQQREVAPTGPSPTTATIENDLRRILKMDVLGSDGASGVRS